MEVKRIEIVWRAEHAGEQLSNQFGPDWTEILRELHAKRQCDCCAPQAYAPNGARAWVDAATGEVVRGRGWEDVVRNDLIAAAARFHSLAAVAAANGGFWVSFAGGTANVVAGEIARATGASFEEAHHALAITGGENWYAEMAYAQPWPLGAWHDDVPGRWDARTIARAACRSARASGSPATKARNV